jgi:tetratricopeptide (TPR) repeat protein
MVILVLAAAQAPAQNACDSLKDFYRQARCFNSRNMVNEALFAMHKAVRKDAASYEKSFYYLKLLIRAEDKIGLRKFLPGFERRFAGSGECAIEISRGYRLIKKWKKGIAALEKAYGRSRQFAYLKEMAVFSMHFKKHDYTESIVEKMLQADSAYADAYYLLGRISLEKGLVKKIKARKKKEDLLRDALAHFERAVHFDSTNAGYFLEIANVYEGLDLWDSTCIAYRKAVSLDPRNFGLVYQFGKKLHEKRLYEEALEMMEKAFLLDSMNVDLLLDIEKVHRSQGTYGEYYLTGQERLANAMPDTLSIRYNLALEYSKQKMYDKAAAAFRKVLAKDSLFEEANAGLAAVYLFQEDFRAALPHLKRQAKASPKSDRAAYQLAQCHLALGDTLSAMPVLERAVRLNPNLAGAAYFLGTEYYNAKEYRKCLAVLKDNPDYPDQAGMLRMRGGSRFHLKTGPALALKDLKRCVGTSEDDETLHYMLAVLYERVKNKKKAVSEYKKCLKMSKDKDKIKYYKSRIKALK